MRAKPLAAILLVVLLAMWILYPTMRDTYLRSDNEITTTYTYAEGELVPMPD